MVNFPFKCQKNKEVIKLKPKKKVIHLNSSQRNNRCTHTRKDQRLVSARLYEKSPLEQAFFGHFSATSSNKKLAISWVFWKFPWVFWKIPWVFWKFPWVFLKKSLSFLENVEKIRRWIKLRLESWFLWDIFSVFASLRLNT